MNTTMEKQILWISIAFGAIFLGVFAYMATPKLAGAQTVAPTVSVNIIKSIDGVPATAALAASTSFPMLATFNSVLLGNATNASYNLGPAGFSGSLAYQATFANAEIGASYATSEDLTTGVVGASCAEGKPFALVGYGVGADLTTALAASISTTSPSFPFLTTDETVVVYNQTCVAPLRPGSLTIVKNVLNGNGTFNFNLTDSASTSALTSIATTLGSGTSTSFLLNASSGPFTISELASAGFTFISSSCVASSSPIGSSTQNGITLSLLPGLQVICTFVNGADVTVTIVKDISGVHATAATAASSTFPLTATYSAANIGSGSSPFTLSPIGSNSPNPYEAMTIPLSSGANYSVTENTNTSVVGPNCANAAQFQLVGYTTGPTLAAAQAGTPTTTPPSLTNITTNQFIVVWNAPCVSVTPPLPASLTIIKNVLNGNGTFNFNLADAASSSPLTSITTALGAGTSTTFSLNASSGPFRITELPLNGFTLSSSTCTASSSPIGTSIAGGVALTLLPGANVICKFTNGADVKVTIVKNVNGVHATSGNAATSSFPLTATWSATNIGSGTGSFTLSPVGFNTATPYEAVTSAMTTGANYSVFESTSTSAVGASCVNGAQFRLLGYSIGDTLAQAQAGAVTLTNPNLLNILTNKYIIVWNEVCRTTPPPPPNVCAITQAPIGYTTRYGTSGNDAVVLMPNTFFIGNGGNDVVTGPAGNYIVVTGDGNDSISLGNGNQIVCAGNGVNSIKIGNGSSTVMTGSGSDSIRAGDGPMTINAGGGTNSIATGNGDKNVTTGSGDDSIITGSGNDTINAGDGTNVVNSGAGNDSVTTGSGNDSINAGPGIDTCSAGGGSNVVVNCSP